MGRVFTLVAEVSLREVETPSLKRNIYDNIRVILVGNLDGGNLDVENEGKTKVYYP